MRHELKRRVVHRKHDAHRAIPGSLRPLAAVPALQGRTYINKSEHCLALFEQDDVLYGALRHFRRDLDLQSTRQNSGQGLAIDEKDSARSRCR